MMIPMSGRGIGLNKRPGKKINKRRGFTIVELTLVVAVIGVLVTITIVSYNAVRQNALNQVVSTDLQKAISALNKFKAENGMYPSVFSQLEYQPKAGVTYQYTYVATNDSYCVTASSRDADFNAVNGSRDLRAGGCAGHGLLGQPPITNFILNPSLEQNAVNVSAVCGTGGACVGVDRVPSSSAASGGHVGQYRWSTGPSGGEPYVLFRSAPITPSRTYVCSGSVRASWATQLQVRIVTYTSAGSWLPQVNSATTSVQANGPWVRLSASKVAESNAATAGCIFVVPNGSVRPPSGATMDIDAVMINEGSIQKYADGSSPGWAWNGAPGQASSSGPALK